MESAKHEVLMGPSLWQFFKARNGHLLRHYTESYNSKARLVICCEDHAYWMFLQGWKEGERDRFMASEILKDDSSTKVEVTDRF